MIKIVRFKDGSVAIGSNNDDLRDYVDELLVDRGNITKQYIVCKDEVDAYIEGLMNQKGTLV